MSTGLAFILFDTKNYYLAKFVSLFCFKPKLIDVPVINGCHKWSRNV